MIYLGSDHGGFKLKEKITEYLESKNYKYQDCGTYNNSSCDYPDFASQVVECVKKEKNNLGILICGTGIGMSIAANKYSGIRATLCYDEITAELSREHNDANILCLGERTTGIKKSLEILDIWLNTPFSNEKRHIKRLEKINNIFHLS